MKFLKHQGMGSTGCVIAEADADGALNFNGMSLCGACTLLAGFQDVGLHVSVIARKKLAEESPSSSGAVLSHMQQVADVRIENSGASVCIFKFGITAQPLKRWYSYKTQNYLKFTVIHATNSLMEACWGEAALIALSEGAKGCRNIRKGGDGPLHVKGDGPPYFIYIVTSRADLAMWVF